MSKHAVTLLDYGMCNMLNVARALESVGATVHVTDSANDAVLAERLVVPGVGAFSECMKAVNALGLGDAIKQFIGSGRPMLGICVGMQILFDSSEEFGDSPGLGILPGRVCAIPDRSENGELQRVPHIGWNHLISSEGGRSWEGSILSTFVDSGPAVYFVHSFAAQPAHLTDRLADCSYGGHRICAAVQRGNVTATQFHPERSGMVGLRMLEQFLIQ